MSSKFSNTMIFASEEIKQEMIRKCLTTVDGALKEKGYNAVQQIAGYLISNDPAYISSNQNARTLIQQVDRDEIIEELVKYYLNNQHE